MSGFLGFALTEEQVALQQTLRRYLADACTPHRVRDVLEGRAPYADDVWNGLAALGVLGVAIPEEYEGAGLGVVELCVLAEECGRVLAPIPSCSTLYLFSELIKLAGSAEQKRAHLTAVAHGRTLGTLAHLELSTDKRPQAPQAYVDAGRLYGEKHLVADAMIAGVYLVLAREGRGAGSISLFAVDATDEHITKNPVDTIDPTRRYGRLRLDGARAERLGAIGAGAALIEAAIKRAAVFVAFEQIGGAERALELAVQYARTRYAFGRPIGSFQAVKQLLADMYVSLQIARANALYAAWALETRAPDCNLAAARAHFSATRAFRHCAADCIQVHGGAGFMWDVDVHLFFRRAELLAQCLGGASHWAERLAKSLKAGRGRGHG